MIRNTLLLLLASLTLTVGAAPAAKAKPVARSKTVAKPTTRSTAAAVKKVVKKATRK